MTNHESAINGILQDNEVYRELKDQVVEVVSDRLRYYLSDVVLDAIFSDDETRWAILEQDLTDTAMDVLGSFAGHDVNSFSGTD